MLNLNKRKIIFRFTLMILWMLVIFMFSMQDATKSSGTSGRILMWIGQILHIDLLHSPMVDTLQFIVRKCAHMFSYFILGILSFRAFDLIKDNAYPYAVIISVLYACSDEFHQLFVPGRSGQIKDVCIDSLGLFIGLLMIYLYRKIKTE